MIGRSYSKWLLMMQCSVQPKSVAGSGQQDRFRFHGRIFEIANGLFFGSDFQLISLGSIEITGAANMS